MQFNEKSKNILTIGTLTTLSLTSGFLGYKTLNQQDQIDAQKDTISTQEATINQQKDTIDNLTQTLADYEAAQAAEDYEKYLDSHDGLIPDEIPFFGKLDGSDAASLGIGAAAACIAGSLAPAFFIPGGLLAIPLPCLTIL